MNDGEKLDAPVVSVAQAARELKTTQKNIRQWLATGRLETVITQDGRRAIRLASVRALQAARRPSATVPRGGRAVDPTVTERPLEFVAICEPLIEVLSDIPDFRMRRGRRYSLSSLLTLGCAAMLCGSRSYTMIALWARYYGAGLMHDLGFNSLRVPCALTFYLVFCGLDTVDFEQRLSTWVHGITDALPGATSVPAAASSASTAGATPCARNSVYQDAPGHDVLMHLGHLLGLRPGRDAVVRSPEEMAMLSRIITGVVLDGQVLKPAVPAVRRLAKQFHTVNGGPWRDSDERLL